MNNFEGRECAQYVGDTCSECSWGEIIATAFCFTQIAFPRIAQDHRSAMLFGHVVSSYDASDAALSHAAWLQDGGWFQWASPAAQRAHAIATAHLACGSGAIATSSLSLLFVSLRAGSSSRQPWRRKRRNRR